MSDNEQGASGRAGAWTEDAKMQFLLCIIAQFKGEGKSINWTKINLPGRTTKSLQNQWTKINKQIADLEAANAAAEDGGAPPVKPTTQRRTAKAKAVKNENEDDNDFGSVEATPTTKTPRKRRATATPKSSKKLKLEETFEDMKGSDESASN